MEVSCVNIKLWGHENESNDGVYRQQKFASSNTI